MSGQHPAPVLPSPPSNWELNVFKIQIVMMREHGSEARGGQGEGAASQRVAWWHSLGLNYVQVSGENISAADLFN